MIPIDYDIISYGNNPGYLNVKKNGLWGVCDSTGKNIIPLAYDNISNYSASDVYTVKKGTLYGAFDITGKNVLPVEYDAVTFYNSQYHNFIVKKGAGFGVVSVKGEAVIPIQYERISPDDKYRGLLKVMSAKKIALFTANGKQLTDFNYNTIVNFNSGGLAMFRTGDPPNLKAGIIDTLGKERLPATTYDEIGFFTPGILKVYTGKYPNLKIGLITLQGKTISQNDYSQVDNFSKGWARVTVGIYPNKKMGFIDSAGNEVIKPRYTNIQLFDRNGLAIIQLDRQYGIINKRDEVIVQPMYDKIDPYGISSDFIVMKGGKYGLLDISGKVLVPPAYDELKPVGPHTFVVSLNQKQGLLNSEGKLAIPLKYDKFVDDNGYVVIDQGILKAELDGRRCAVDLYGNEYYKTGEPVTNYTFVPDKEGYVNTPEFQQFIKLRGFQLVSAFDTLKRNPLIIAAQVMVDGTWKLIDTKGKYISAPASQPPYIPTNEVPVRSGSFGDPNADIVINSPVEPHDDNETGTVFEVVQAGNKYGTLDKLHHKQGLPAIYDHVYYMGKGWAYIDQDGKHGAAKMDGSLTIAPKYQDIRPGEYNGNFADQYFIIKSGDKYGLLSGTGSEIISPKYDLILSCGGFDRGNQLLRVSADKKWGLINKRGKVLAEPVYDGLEVLMKNMMRTSAGTLSDRKYGLIDTTGKVLLEPLYRGISVDFQKKIINLVVMSGDVERYGLMDFNGKLLLQPIYSGISEFYPGLLIVKLNGKYGLVKPDGKFVIEPGYELLSPVDKTYEMEAKKDGKYGILTMNGVVVIPVQYEALFAAGTNFVFKRDGKWGTMNRQQKVLSTLNYDSVLSGYNCLIVELNGKWGLVTMDGRLITSIKYDEFRDNRNAMKGGLAEVEMNHHRGVVDHYGNEYFEKDR